MKKSLILICGLLLLTGCGNKGTEDNEIDISSENVLACTSMKYNIFGNYESDVVENHMFIAEYDDSKTNMVSATEIYTADYSNADKKPTGNDLEELKEGFKTRFCDVRKRLITPDGYEGEEVTCNITDKDNVITVKMVYPESAIEYAKNKGKLGSLEEVKENIEANNMAWFYNNYFNCDKNYDKSNYINQEIKRTLNLTYFANAEFKFGMRNLANELNMQNRFYEEVFEEYKIDTNNRISLKPIDEELGYEEGDYTLTYNCAADSVQTCNTVVDYVIDSFIERAKDFQVTVTRK